MPKITQQTNRAAPVSSNGKVNVLDRIAPVAANKIGRMKCSFYGEPKTGKTRLACTFPKPMLLIGAEDGTASVVGTKGLEFVLLHHTDEIYDLIEGPIKAGKFASVGVDHSTKLRGKRIEEFFALKNMEAPERKPFIYADKIWKEAWGYAAQYLYKSLGMLLDLPNRMDLNVVILSQEGKLNYEDNSSSDLIKPSIGPAIAKTAADWLSAECDFTGQCIIRQQFEEVKAKLAGAETVTRKPTGKRDYALRIVRDEIYYAGFRIPLNKELKDDFIVDPSYDKIVKLIS